MKTGSRFVWVGIPEPNLSPTVKRDLERLSPGGVILFERNVESADQLHELVAELRTTVPSAFLAVDFEGGRVNRFRKIVGEAPAARDLMARSPERSFEAGRWIGHALRHFGIDVDFAPVVDLDRGHTGNALDDRYFGARPAEVIDRAGAFLRGLSVAGVRGCLKHFPGLGEARADTHEEGAPIELVRTELEADLEPFRALGNEAGAIMVGHAIYIDLDRDAERPATVSPPILQDLLRDELGFEGVAISDDLEMKAFGEGPEVVEAAEDSFALGCDVLLVCSDLELAFRVAARLGSPALAERRREASRRLDAYRDRPGRRRPGPVLAEIREGLERLRLG